MPDLRIGSNGDVPIGQLPPLQARGPAWLSYPVGSAVSSGATAGLPAAGLFFSGQQVPLLFVGIVGGFMFICLTAGLLVFTPERRTGPNLFAGVFSVGHTLLLGLLAAAYFLPGGRELAASLITKVPFLAALPVLPGSIAAVAPLYLTAFVAFSVLAPLAIILFRYLALNRPSQPGS